MVDVTLEHTTDILAELGSLADDVRPLLVGFAAETGEVEVSAREKLGRKNLDFIVANQVGGDDCTFGADDAVVTLLSRDGGRHRIGPGSKRSVADTVLGHIIEAWQR